MEQGTIIFVAILVLSVATPIVILSRNKKKKEREFLNSFFHFAGKTLSEYQIWNKIIIGLDRETGMMFFIRKNDANEITKEVDLSGINKCRVINNGKNITNSGGNYIVTNGIDLAFTSRVNNQQEITFEIYDSNLDNPVLQGELQLAEKWAEIANSFISGKNRIN